jgi:ABC-type sugar transport system ATPase subunit
MVVRASDAIVVKGLCASRGKGSAARQVLQNVDLNVPRGTLHMLVGPNGCGKVQTLSPCSCWFAMTHHGLGMGEARTDVCTDADPVSHPWSGDAAVDDGRWWTAQSTLLRLLAGMIQPSSGSVTMDRPASLVFQNPDQQVVMPTVGADVAFGLGNQQVALEEVRACKTACSLSSEPLCTCLRCFGCGCKQGSVTPHPALPARHARRATDPMRPTTHVPQVQTRVRRALAMVNLSDCLTVRLLLAGC